MAWFDFLFRKKTAEKVENPDLIKIMTQMSANPDMKVRRALYREFLKSTFLLPMPAPVADFSSKLKSGASVDVKLVSQRGAKGELVWMAFTDEKALSMWKSTGGAFVTLPGSQFFSMAVRNNVDNILVNCAGPVSGQITKMEINMLVEGTLPDEAGEATHTLRFKENTQVFIGAPVQQPRPELVSYLKEKLGDHPDVLAGYLVLMTIGAAAPHLVLGVQFKAMPHQEPTKRMFDSLGKGLHPFLGQGEYLDMFPFDPTHEWFQSIQKSGIVVYKKA
jgi:hypothetical protein